MKNKTTKGTSGMTKIAVVGASVAALAAAYFFLGPKGKKHQAQTKAWAIKMKADVIEKLENATEVSEAAYHEIIDAVSSEYKKSMKANRTEITALADDLKKHWKTITGSK